MYFGHILNAHQKKWNPVNFFFFPDTAVGDSLINHGKFNLQISGPGSLDFWNNFPQA